MPSRIFVLGSCLIAVSTATAADLSANPAGQPWWSNAPAAASSDSGLKVAAEHPPAAGGPKTTELAPSGRDRHAVELAPDPPGSRRSDAEVLRTALQEDSASSAQTTAADKPAIATLLEKTKADDTALHAAGDPPLQLPATAASHAPPAEKHKPPAADAAPPARQDAAMPLRLSGHDEKGAPARRSPLYALLTVGGSLAIVLGLFLVVAWAMRKAAPRGSLVLPKEVFDILGRAPLGARQQVQLLRCGNKLLLVSITPAGVETLTEVTDPLEVDRIAGICQQTHPKSATMAFRQVFQELAPKSGEPSGLDDPEPAGTRRKRYRWEEGNV